MKLALLIPPQWARIDWLRQAVMTCVAAVFSDKELEQALSMASAELLENAIKYGLPDGDRIAFELYHDANDAVIEVQNTSTPAAVARLGEQLAWLASFDSPSKAYEAALSRVSAHGGDSVSGLGLVRIAFEGGCRLSHAFDGTRVCVQARRACPAPPP